MLCLVDNDPYGMNIYGVYKYGSETKSTIENERLVIPSLRYLGVSSEDFRGGDEEGLMELTERDRRKVDVMLEKEWVKKEEEVL